MESAEQVFLDRMAEVLEVPSISPDDDFRSVPRWSSLAGFSTLVMIENEYGRTLSAADLQGAHTVGELARLAGVLG